MKNLPARTRPALRSRSSYSNPQREGGAKTEYKYPAWVQFKHKPPVEIMRELRVAHANINCREEKCTIC